MSEENAAPAFSEEELIAAARDLYEGTHGMTMGELAEFTGISPSVLGAARRRDGWKKALETKTGATTDAAIEAADLFRQRALTPITVSAPAGGIADEKIKVLVDPLPREVDAMLERHRKEWSAPRAMAVEAVQLRNTDAFRAFERAKLAKITAETLKIVQDGERKAHGIDAGEAPPGKHLVVIERPSIIEHE